MTGSNSRVGFPASPSSYIAETFRLLTVMFSLQNRTAKSSAKKRSVSV